MREKEVLKRLYELIKPYRFKLTIAMICMLIVSLFSAGQAYIMKPAIDEIFINKDRQMLFWVPLALIFIFLVKGIFSYCNTYILNKVGISAVMNLRSQMFNHIQVLPFSFFNKTSTGELISRIMSDIGAIRMTISNVFIGLIKDFFQVIFLIGVVFYQDWQLALVSLIFIPMVTLPLVQFGRKHRKLSLQSQENQALISNFLHETITGTRIVKAFCMEEYEGKRFAKKLEKLLDILMRDVKLSSFSHPLMELFGGIGIALVLWYGGSKVLNGVSTPGTFFSFLAALIMIYEPIKGLSKVNSTFQLGVASTIRVYSILDIQPDICDKISAYDLPAVNGQITFQDVHFSYNHNEEVLKGFNLVVQPGEVVALVGTSGGGKSTLVNLIPRFYDVSQGNILIDGHDIKDITLKSLRSQIAMVTQQTILFNDTIKNNIAYGDTTRTDDEIKEASRAAYALDFIERLPEGFDTVIGESGARLSGGQRQRLSIARALLKNAPILILDEATSALDTDSEREVQNALENLVKSRTTLVIAHRLSTIKNADRIIVMQDGNIAEDGKHDELLNREGIYKKLYHNDNQGSYMNI